MGGAQKFEVHVVSLKGQQRTGAYCLRPARPTVQHPLGATGRTAYTHSTQTPTHAKG